MSGNGTLHITLLICHLQPDPFDRRQPAAAARSRVVRQLHFPPFVAYLLSCSQNSSPADSSGKAGGDSSRTASDHHTPDPSVVVGRTWQGDYQRTSFGDCRGNPAVSAAASSRALASDLDLDNHSVVVGRHELDQVSTSCPFGSACSCMARLTVVGPSWVRPYG